MKILYLDCSMGAAGDMLTAALLELLPDPQAFVQRLNALQIPGVTYEAEPASRCGITGTMMTVRINGHTEEDFIHPHDHHDIDCHDHEHADHHDQDHADCHHHHDHSDCHHHDHDHTDCHDHHHTDCHDHDRAGCHDHPYDEHTDGCEQTDCHHQSGHHHDHVHYDESGLSARHDHDHHDHDHYDETSLCEQHRHDHHDHVHYDKTSLCEQHHHDHHDHADNHDHADGHDHIQSHHHDHHHHSHSSLHEIEAVVNGLRLPDHVKANVMGVYQKIAEAESHAHGVPVTEIHFHEVGTMDAVADITAVCLLMNELKADQVIVSPIHVGSGQVRCAHGILPVPAPATAWILRDVPIYGGSIQGELCTPTGAALVKEFANGFGAMPLMRVAKIGYGMGKREFEAANCVRAMLGESTEALQEICELQCNVDDMSAEAIGFAMERLFAAGALDVFTTPVGMKKSRPGTLISVLCPSQKKEFFADLIFRHTTTLGVRFFTCGRYALKRSIEERETVFGPVRCKKAWGYGVSRSKYEYEDLAEIALRQDLSLEEVRKRIEQE